jgi:Flp pilus assembly protein TadG
MAIVLPILLMIVLGILDFGRAVNYWNDQTHVANLAARYAAVGQLPSDSTCGTGKFGNGESLSQYISCQVGIDSSELANGSTSTNPVDGPQGALGIKVCIPNNTAGQPVTVTLTSRYQWLPFLGRLSVTSSSVTGTATQEIENPPPAGWATSC